jgi:hypothetical protein
MSHTRASGPVRGFLPNTASTASPAPIRRRGPRRRRVGRQIGPRWPPNWRRDLRARRPGPPYRGSRHQHHALPDHVARARLTRRGDHGMMTTFVFQVRNIPAALYKAMGGFATNGVNMTKLESYMVDGSFTATQFYADIEGHPEDRQRAAGARGAGVFHQLPEGAGDLPGGPGTGLRRGGSGWRTLPPFARLISCANETLSALPTC